MSFNVFPLALQVSPSDDPTVLAVVFAMFIVSGILGILIAIKAFSGYRHTGSMPMMFLAFGVICLTAIPALLSLVLTNLTGLPDYMIVIATKSSEVLGLLSIFYSLYGDFD